MNDLKKSVSKMVKEFVDTVFDEADQAEDEERYINKSVIGKQLNQLYGGLDMAFIDFSERVKQKKGRIF